MAKTITAENIVHMKIYTACPPGIVVELSCVISYGSLGILSVPKISICFSSVLSPGRIKEFTCFETVYLIPLDNSNISFVIL